MQPRLLVEQKITVFANQYRIFQVNPGGQKGPMIAYAHQKRLAFKEKVIFYTDESKTQEAFSLRAEKVFDIHGKYFIEDTAGQLVGSFKKDFTKSLLNSTWMILDANDTVTLRISESNKVLAVLRRFAGFVPYVGDLFEIIMLLFKYHFTFMDAMSGQQVGRYQKTTLFRDHYRLELTDAAYQTQDWRVLAAMAVGLDALQSR